MNANGKIIVDNRERNTELINTIELNQIEIEFKTLPVGDYLISERVCIERKTIHDFESSIMNGRLFDQIKRLKEQYEFPILIIEGPVEEFRLKSRVINGTIAAIYIDYGIEIINTYNAANTAEIIEGIARHEQNKEIRGPSLKGGFRAHSHEQFQEYIIGNIPGVGPKLAKSLLKHFKNIRNIANAPKEELVKIEKIGSKKAELIYKTLNEKYENENIE